MRILLSLAIICSISGPVMANRNVNTQIEALAIESNLDVEFQNKDAKDAALDKQVQQIEAECAAINAKKLNIRIVNIEEGQLDEGCGVKSNVTYYNAAGENPEKIDRWLAGDSTEELIEFYYKDGKLIFIHRKQVYYPPATGAEPVQSELKIYLDKGKPVKYVSNQGDTYQNMDFASEVREGNALLKATANDQVRDAICPAE